MCQFSITLYPTEKVPWCLYTLFEIDVVRIKMNCNCGVKPQTCNVVYDLNRKISAISALATMKFIHMTFTENLSHRHQNSISIGILPNTCEAYSSNIVIPDTVEMISNDPILT